MSLFPTPTPSAQAPPLRWRDLRRHRALSLLYGYLSSMYIYLLLRLFTDHRLWVVAWITSFLPLLLLLALPLLPLALWRRHWLPALLLLGLLAVFVGLFGEQFMPKQPNPPADAYRLRAMTYNVGSWASEPASIAAAIVEMDADLVALQELDAATAQAIRASQAYPYQIFYTDTPNITLGKGLLSRYPILEHEIFYRETQRPYLRAEVLIAGQVVTVYNFHPDPPGYLRYDQVYGYNALTLREIEWLGRQIDPARPTLLLCDCNFTDQYPSYGLLAEAGLRDTFRAAGWGLGMSYPASGLLGFRPPLGLGLLRIDYIWASASFTPLRAWLGPDGGSDHLPLLAELALSPGPAATRLPPRVLPGERGASAADSRCPARC